MVLKIDPCSGSQISHSDTNADVNSSGKNICMSLHLGEVQWRSDERTRGAFWPNRKRPGIDSAAASEAGAAAGAGGGLCCSS